MISLFHQWRDRGRTLARIEQGIADLKAGQESIRMDLTKLQTAVANETTVEASAVTLIQQIADELKQANGDQAAVDALADQIKANADALAASVVANTPPPAPPAA